MSYRDELKEKYTNPLQPKSMNEWLDIIESGNLSHAMVMGLIAERDKIQAELAQVRLRIIAQDSQADLDRDFAIEHDKVEKKLRAALREISETARQWEGRKEAPFWNLGDIADKALGVKK